MSLYLLIVILTACNTSPELRKIQNRQLQQIGSAGSEPGEFQEPRGLHAGPDQTLIVTDFRNYRIQQIDRNGKALHSWGSKGNGPGELNDPADAVMDSEGNLYVVDTWNHRIQKCLANGEWQLNWASGTDFYAPRGIAVDSNKKVYVANTSQHNIKVFNSTGKLLATWGSKGTAREQFHDPVGLAIGPDGNLYVADTGNHRLKVIGPGGQVLSVFPIPDLDGEAFNETFVSVGPDGKIFLSVPQLNHILVLNTDGSIFSRFGKKGGGPEELFYPTGILVDESQSIYISDSLNHRIVKYTYPSPLVAQTPTKQSTLHRILSITRIVLDLIALIIVIVALTRKLRSRNRHVLSLEKTREPSKIQLKIRKMSGYPKTLLMLFLSGSTAVGVSLWLYSIDKPGLASIIAVVGLVLIALQEMPRTNSESFPRESRDMTRNRVLMLTLILLCITVLLRVYRFDEIPWGINNDAAWNGTFARLFLDGKEPYTPFTDQAWGKETMYFYLVALSFKLFGISRTTLLLPGLVISILTVPVLLLFLKKLFGWRFAFITAFVFSATAWNIVFSRTGYRAVQAPLYLLLTLGFFYLAADTSRWYHKLLYYSAAGSSLGIGLNTYFSFRGIPILMIVIGIFTWIEHRHFMRKNWWGLVLFLLFAILFFTPLAIYAYHNYSTFMARSNFLFVGKKIQESGSLTPLFDNIYRNFLVFTYKAKVGNFFNNDWPIITRFLAFFALIGSAVHVRHCFCRGSFTTLMIFCFGILPAVLSEPDAARGIMSPIAIAIFAATGIVSMLRLLPRSTPNLLQNSVLAMIVLAIMCFESHFYFVRLGTNYFAQYGYACKNTQIGITASELAKNNQIYISQAHFIDTPKFLCYGIPGDIFGITNGEVIEVVSDDTLMKNLQRILNTPVPKGKGLAFILESHHKNDPIFEAIRESQPDGEYKVFRDKRLGIEPIYYTYVVPADKVRRIGSESIDPANEQDSENPTEVDSESL